MTALLLFLILLQPVSTAHAGIIASFTPDGSAFMPSAIDVGDTIDVPLYLWYDGTDTNFLNSPGLYSAGLGVTFNPGVANVTLLSLGSDWDPVWSDQYDSPAGTAGIVGGVPFGSVVMQPQSILVGTLTFTGISAGTLMLTLVDYIPMSDDTAVDDGIPTILDDVIQFGGTASIIVNAGSAAVPEPSAGILLLLGAGVLAWRRRSREALPV